MAQGIVAPQDFVNKKSLETLNSPEIKLNDGIFVLNETEIKNLNLSEPEKKIIKPYYTSEELEKYHTKNKNKFWIIYTNSQFKDVSKIEKYPTIKKHLDKFSPIITSDNKPYGLHRSRDERFFKNEKIMSLRKCKEPLFTFTEFDCYVSQSYFVIKTNRVNMKYLSVYLNSKIVKFWLKFKGKMQGQIYQVDKIPLLEIPILISEYENDIIQLFDNIKDNVNNIDALFYKNFNMSDDEIQIIENHLSQ